MSEEGFNKAWPDGPGRKLRRAVQIARGEITPPSTQDMIDAMKEVYDVRKIVHDQAQASAPYATLKRS